MKRRITVWKQTVQAGLCLSALIAALWAFSAVWAAGWRSPGRVYVGIGHGAAGITEKHSGWSVKDFETGWKFERARGGFAWWISRHSGGRDWWFWVPLWMPLAGTVLLTGAASILHQRASRQVQSGLCAACGYDRAGLRGGASAKCPECGSVAG